MNKFASYINTEELRKSRNKKGLSYNDMAREMGLKSPISYYNLEVGIIEPKISQMLKVSKILNRPVHKFFNLKLQETWIKKEGKLWITKLWLLKM